MTPPPPPKMIDNYYTLHTIDAETVDAPCEYCRLGKLATHYAHTDDPGRAKPHSLFLCDFCADMLVDASIAEVQYD